jgi:hypothetical protein
MSGVMVTNNFNNLSLDISRNLKILTQQAYKMWDNEWKKIIEKDSVDLKINKQIRYEGAGSAGQVDEGQSATQKAVYEGHIESATQVDYAVELAISYQQRRYVVKNADFMNHVAMYNARSMKLVYEYNSANVLNNGFSSSFTGGDGKAYFANDHYHKSDATTYNNLLAAVDMGRDAMEDAFKAIATVKEESSIPMMLIPKKLHYSTDDIFTVPELLKTIQDPESANNTHNAIVDYNIKPNLNHYISDTDSYYIDTQLMTRKLLISLPTTFDQYMQDETKNLVERGWCAQATMFHDPAGCHGSQGG